MKPANIKEPNLKKILAFINGDVENAIQGAQLRAFYKLIQKKGEPIKSNDEKLNGVKCILLPDNQCCAMTFEPVGESFYPCVITVYSLEKV